MGITLARFLLIFSFLFTGNLCLAQGWEKTFVHSTGLGKGFDAIQTSDNGYVMVGELDLPTGAIRHYIWLVKTDNDGNELWSKIYGFNNVADHKGKALVETAEGDLLIAGADGNKASVLKTNAEGDSLWTRNFGGAGMNIFQDIIATTNDQFILVGQYEAQANSGLHEVWAMWMNTAGDSLWSEQYFDPSPIRTSAMDISSLSDNNYLITGTVGGLGFSTKISGDSGSGTPFWEQVYTLSSNDNILAGAANGATESSFLMGGATIGVIGETPTLFETDETGVFTNPVSLSLPGMGAITAITPTLDEGFILSGSSYDFWSLSGISTGFITKINTNLDPEWTLTFEDSLDKQGAMIRQYSDGHYIMAGSRQGGMWLKKIAGTTTTTDELVNDSQKVKVYPKPANTSITIELPPYFDINDLSMNIYNSTGGLVKKVDVYEHIQQVSIANLSKGIYYYGIHYYGIHNSQRQLTTGKLLIQ